MTKRPFDRQGEKNDFFTSHSLIEADKNIFQNSRFTQLRPGIGMVEVNSSSIFPIKKTLVLRDSPLQFGFHLAGRGKGHIRQGRKTLKTIEACPASTICSFLPHTTCVMELPENEYFQVINLYLERNFLRDIFATQNNLNHLPEALTTFLSGHGNKIFSNIRSMTPRTRLVLEELTNCPYHGVLKKIYQEAKAMELVALQFGELNDTRPSPPRLCRQTKERLYAARDILQSHPQNPPTIPKLAKEVGLSESLVKKGFRMLFQTTPHAFVVSCRLEQARKLLLQGDRTVSEIAWQLGFCDPAHFVRQFKARFGLTPGNYAKNCS